MRVGQLLDKLKNLDPDMAVLCYTEEADFVSQGHLFRLFEIDSVDVSEAERLRADEQVPTLKFGKSPHSETFAILNVTADF